MSSNANPQRTYEIPSINKMMLYVREQVDVHACKEEENISKTFKTWSNLSKIIRSAIKWKIRTRNKN